MNSNAGFVVCNLETSAKHIPLTHAVIYMSAEKIPEPVLNNRVRIELGSMVLDCKVKQDAG